MHRKAFAVLTGLLVLLHFSVAQIKMEGMGRAVSGGKPMVRISFFEGEVEVVKAATGQTVKAYINLTLATGDQIITKAESQAEVDMNEVDVLKLGANSVVELTAIIMEGPKEDPVTIKQTAGKIVMTVKKLINRKEVTITSPTAVAAVRGTTVGQELLNDGSTKVVCLDGSVWVENVMFKGKGFMVKSGQWSQVRQSQVPLMPKDLLESELNEWNKLKESGAKGKAAPDPDPEPDQGSVTQPTTTPATTTTSTTEPAPTTTTGPSTTTSTTTTAPATEQTEEKKEDAPADKAAADDGPKDKFSMGGAAGTYTDEDGNQVTYISLRPEIPVWKFGVALDVQLGFVMEEGGGMVFNKDDWDEPGDIIDKIYYVRFGKEGDPLYIRAGALPPLTLGYGLIMNSYSNTIEYPDNKRIGIQVGIRRGKFGLDGMLNSVREIGNSMGGGLIGARAAFRAHQFLEFGATYVGDFNQYANLTDTDDDGSPDYIDKFPEDEDEWLDTDDDGYADGSDQDVDGDNKIEIPAVDLTAADSLLLSTLGVAWEDTSEGIKDPEPFNLKNVSTKEKMAHVVGADVGIPVIDKQFLKLKFYGQVAKILGVEDGGLGFAAPGAMFAIGPLNIMAEYRNFQDKFMSSYFDELYELERVTISSDGSNADPVTKKASLEALKAVQGYYAQLGVDIFKMVTVTASYEDLKGEDTDTDKTVYAQLDINTSVVPKLSQATAYYKKSHVVDFSTWRQEGAILGYKLGYELSPGTSLIFCYQETYTDKDGNGKIKGDEVDRRTSIETAFTF